MSEPRQDDLRRAMSTLVRERTPHGVPPFPGFQRRSVRHRRVRTFAVTALAALVLVAGAAVTVRVRDARPDRAPVAALPVDGPAPQRTTRDGMQFQLTGEAPLTKVWIDQRDRSSLVVEAGEDLADVTGACGAFTVLRILAQDDGTVSLGALRYPGLASNPQRSVGAGQVPRSSLEPGDPAPVGPQLRAGHRAVGRLSQARDQALPWEWGHELTTSRATGA